MRTNYLQFQKPQQPFSGRPASVAGAGAQFTANGGNVAPQPYRPTYSTRPRPSSSVLRLRQARAQEAAAAQALAEAQALALARIPPPPPARTIPWKDTGLPFTSTGEICYRKHGFTPEDFVNSRNHLLVTNGSYYLASLRQASQLYGFSLKEIPASTIEHNLWLRDYYLNSYDSSTVVLDRRYGCINGTDFFSSSRNFPDTVACGDPACQTQHKIIWKNPSTLPNKVLCKQLHAGFMRNVIYDPKLYYSLSRGRTELHLRPGYVKPTAFATRQTDINIEGGNVIQAINQEGIPKLIIGLNGLLGTAFLQTLLTQNSNFAEVIQIAINRISEVMDIEPENIIVVPQWIYHLDCMLAYVGDATFLVHSFETTCTVLGTIKPPTAHKDLYARLRTAAGNGYTKFETSIVNTLIALLTSHGFKAIKCMGVLFHGRGIDDHSRNAYETFSSAPVTIANFMNGVAGIARNGTRFYLTNNCAITRFNLIFSTFLRSLEQPIETYYCNVDPALARTYSDQWLEEVKKNSHDAYELIMQYYYQNILNNTTLLLSLSSGGVRCQTNMHYEHDMPEITRPTVASAA